MAEVPVRASAGVVATVDGTRVVVLDDGTRIKPLWPPIVVADGDLVQVILIDQVAHVLGPVATAPRPDTGTVASAASNGLIPVTTGTGTVQARYVGTAPAIGTLVALIWQGTTPLLMPGTAVTPTPEPTPEPDLPSTPPAPPQTGTLLVTAQGSGTWRTGTWGWASSTDVLQGAWSGGQDSRGGWWHGSAARALAGRTITGARLRLGARTRIGNYNSPAVLHTYRTTDGARPGTDFTRVAGPHDITIPAGAGAGWHALPTSWGQALVDSGGGIGLQGNPYTGITGVGGDPESGQLALDWTR